MSQRPIDSDTFPAQSRGRIGPNAILQLVEPVEQKLGSGTMTELLARCHVALPAGDEMISEEIVADVHQNLHRLYPDEAPEIARAAGFGTAHYVRANRIPAPVRIALRHLPTSIGARLLTKAIARHAWTFCGSGVLDVQAGKTIRFQLRNNPTVHGVTSETPVCFWHTAVFEGLFTSVLGRPFTARETTCCAMGAPACTFEVARG